MIKKSNNAKIKTELTDKNANEIKFSDVPLNNIVKTNSKVANVFNK